MVCVFFTCALKGFRRAVSDALETLRASPIASTAWPYFHGDFNALIHDACIVDGWRVWNVFR